MGALIRDTQSHLEELRDRAAECALIRDLATDKRKRQLFTKLANRFAVMVADAERAMSQPVESDALPSTNSSFK
jgi:hypothetical protein